MAAFSVVVGAEWGIDSHRLAKIEEEVEEDPEDSTRRVHPFVFDRDEGTRSFPALYTSGRQFSF